MRRPVEARDHVFAALRGIQAWEEGQQEAGGAVEYQGGVQACQDTVQDIPHHPANHHRTGPGPTAP